MSLNSKSVVVVGSLRVLIAIGIASVAVCNNKNGLAPCHAFNAPLSARGNRRQQQHQSSQQRTMQTATQRMMVSTSDPTSSDGVKSAEKISARPSFQPEIMPVTKYPVIRGTTTDSREIVSTGAGRQFLTAVRLSHILFATEDLALASLHELKTSNIAFEDLSRQISACAETREEGGQIGWVSTNDEDGTKNEHLDLVFPKAAREKTVQITTKPGDIIFVESTRGFHLVQVVDCMVDVRQMAYVKERRNKDALVEKSLKKTGIFGGALTDGTKDLSYKIETMGCQMNKADSERIEGQLQSIGINPIPEDDEKTKPDVVVLNTCSIRDHAEQKVYSYLGPYAKRKRSGGDLAIIVAGCVAQQEGEKLLRRVPEIDLVMGPQYANRIADLLEDVSNGNQVVATEATHIMEDSSKPRRSSTIAAWVNVIYGCNERCAFCIVPTTRGVEQSRPVESIVEEVENLVKAGFKEVTLLGQNVDAYGRDMVPKKKFSDLLRTVGSIPGLERLRFVTSHPKYMSLGVVDAVAEVPAACESFHIPFQSGSTEVLARMGRGHTREKFLHIVNRIRQRLPDAAISADVIVGFPGETEEQFQETLSLMEEVKFDVVNTAAYSPRPNTPAADWVDQVPDDVKHDRLLRINVLVKEHARERRARMQGRTVEVLIEKRNVRKPTQVLGRTRHGYVTYCDGDIDELHGKTVKVLIETCETFCLVGRIVD